MTAVAPGLHRLRPGETLDVHRNEAVVCIPVYGAHESFADCLHSVLAHTAPDVAVVVADDASPDPASAALAEELAASGALRHPLWYLRQPRNLGFVENVNSVFAAAAPADVLVLNSDCVVGPEWLERLRAAAYVDSNVATASALTNNGTILSVPERNRPQDGLANGQTVDEAATAIARGSERLRPRIPTAVGHCIYVRRSALELVGPFDPAFSPGYGEEVDFSQRCALRGLTHVAADDVFVLHRGAASFAGGSLQEAHEREIVRRYPYYHAAVDDLASRDTGPLARALAIASRALTGLSVTIDARCLGPTVTGTQVHALELVHALRRAGGARLRVVVPPNVGETAARALAALEDVEVLRSDEVDASTPRTQIVHRPYQVFHQSELPLLKQLGDRVVITQQDLIAYRNPGYARSGPDWIDLHRLSRITLAFADAVVFFSGHAAQDTLAEELAPADRAEIVYLGVDHRACGPPAGSVRPAALPADLETRSYLLCLGTDFRHKNRVFALEVVARLRERHGWEGRLVLAGPHAAAGTSTAEERELLAREPALAARTLEVGEVSDEEKQWLVEHAAGVLYPSVYEGFGLIPFETAEAGVPCFFAWQTAMTETLPASAATLVPWDAAASADGIAEVLRSEERRSALVQGIREAGSRLLWDQTATEMLEVYERALRRPHRELASVLDGVRDPWTLMAAGAPEALQRLDLPLESYRALLAILARPMLRRPFLACLRAFFRLGFLLRHRRLPEGD